MSIQFREEEVCRIIRALQHYRDYVTSSDEIWDRYNDLMLKCHKYGEEASPDPVSCDGTT